jgi:hypothetical protein
VEEAVLEFIKPVTPELRTVSEEELQLEWVDEFCVVCWCLEYCVLFDMDRIWMCWFCYCIFATSCYGYWICYLVFVCVCVAEFDSCVCIILDCEWLVVCMIYFVVYFQWTVNCLWRMGYMINLVRWNEISSVIEQ